MARDRQLTRKQLRKAAKEWKSEHRITGGKYEWVEDRHVLAAATPEDIGLLLEVRAAVYSRVSDECLDEVQVLENLIRRLSRKRCRKIVGVCPQVEPAEAAQEQPTSQSEPSSRPAP